MDTVRNIGWVAVGSILGIMLLAAAGCGIAQRQTDAESKFAIDVTFWLKVNDVVSPGTQVSNLSQIFPVIPHGYSYYHHRELARFGKHAGFSNSIAEKYSFYLPPFTNRFVQGELLCISTKPFPTERDGPHRIYISRSGSNYIYRLIDEVHVQRIFSEAKPLKVPSGEIKPPPEPPPELAHQFRSGSEQPFERIVRSVANALDQDSASGMRLILKAAMGASVLVSLVILCSWIGRRWRRWRS